MKILVVGANGQVGSELIAILKASQQQYLALSHAECDITQADQIELQLQHFKPDWIVNCAAYTAVDRAESEVAVAEAVNALGAANLARSAAQCGAAILHLSTDFVFAGDKTGAYLETDSAQPLSVYGNSKWQGDLAVAELCAQHIILRVSWVFGRFGKNFVKTMASLLQTREQVSVVNDQFGGPTPARAIAATIFKLINSSPSAKQWGTYNYCGAPAVTWYDLAACVKENLKTPSAQLNSITTAQYPTPAKRPTNSQLDCMKILQEFGVEQPDWREYVAEVLSINQ